MNINIKFTITFLLLTLVSTYTNTNAQIITTRTPVYNQEYYNQNNFTNNSNNINSRDISILEEKIFNRNYNLDNINNRIERLEVNTFGCIQAGNLLTRYINIKNTILSRSNYCQHDYNNDSIVKNLSKFFIGQMTGYTPQIKQNNQFDNQNYNHRNNYNFGNTRYEEYNTPYGHGYYTNNFSSGNNASIKILE